MRVLTAVVAAIFVAGDEETTQAGDGGDAEGEDDAILIADNTGY